MLPTNLTASGRTTPALNRCPVPAAALLALTSVLCVLGVAPASASTQTFTFTGDEQAYAVPRGVHSLHVVAIGAEGGKGEDSATGATTGGVGGLGARIEADLAVSPGQTLFIEVGGAGAPGKDRNLLGAGGFNGGGTSNNGDPAIGQFSSFRGGGGGGATDLRTCSRHAASCPAGKSSLETRLLVAGGGGGGGGIGGPGGYSSEGGLGGFGGNCGSGGIAGEGGLAGTSTAGGAGGDGNPMGTPGSLGLGGSAALNTLDVKPGGGGGGGYFGGGAGGSGCVAGGGGGGSSFEAASATNVTTRDDTTGVAEVVVTPGRATREPEGAPKPAKDFSFGKLTRNRRRGTARLAVILPGPGTLSLKGKGLVAKQLSVQTAGTVKLAIKANGTAKRQLIGKGKTKLKASISFQPTGENPIAKTRPIKLVRKLSRPAPH